MKRPRKARGLTTRVLALGELQGTTQWYTTAEVAALCGVDRRTVLRWAKSGAIESRLTQGGHHRIAAAEARRIAANISTSGSTSRDAPSKPCFLLVDDDRSHSRAFGRMLGHLLPGAEIQTAPDGFVGGVLAERLRPVILFLDLVMPGLDGLAVARSIRSDPALSNVRIIIVSAQECDPEELAEVGVAGHLRKPVDLDELKLLLGGLIQARV